MNEITIKCAPRFAGMENEQEYEKITTELALAKACHPKVCGDFHDENFDPQFGSLVEELNWWKRHAQLTNDVRGAGHETGYGVLQEEMFEAFEACAKEDWRSAYTEFAQVAAVAVRLMEKVRKEHLERKDGEE